MYSILGYKRDIQFYDCLYYTHAEKDSNQTK